MDSRYESSIDGFVRMPAKDQLDIDLSPSYVVTGNHPVVIRESLEHFPHLINSVKTAYNTSL